MESKDDSICKNNDVEIKRNLFKINRGTKKIFNIKNSDICFLSSKKTLYHCLIVSKLLDNNDIKFISNPNKVLWHIWRHPVWIIQLLCWLVLLLPLIAGPITPLYHYLHYALWGISYNLAQATLSLYSGPLLQIVSPAGDKSQHASTKSPGSPLGFSWSWIRRGTLIRGCEWLFSIVWRGGIVCFLPGHDSPRYANGHDKCPNWTA